MCMFGADGGSACKEPPRLVTPASAPTCSPITALRPRPTTSTMAKLESEYQCITISTVSSTLSAQFRQPVSNLPLTVT